MSEAKMVPTFIKEGGKIKVDPANNSYLGREA